jgi:hypothetical protein
MFYLTFLTFISLCIFRYIPYIQPTRCHFSQFIYFSKALHISGGTSTHHQEHRLYIQLLVFVKPCCFLLPSRVGWNYMFRVENPPIIRSTDCTYSFWYLSNPAASCCHQGWDGTTCFGWKIHPPSGAQPVHTASGICQIFDKYQKLYVQSELLMMSWGYNLNIYSVIEINNLRKVTSCWMCIRHNLCCSSAYRFLDCSRCSSVGHASTKWMRYTCQGFVLQRVFVATWPKVRAWHNTPMKLKKRFL